MHILVVWEIEAERMRWTQINDALLDVLSEFETTTVLLTVQVVRIQHPFDRENLVRLLLKRIEQIDHPVELLVSPVMEGRYEGYLPDETWPEVNRLTG